MRIKNQKDFFCGLIYVGVGAGFALGATNYTIGDGARMGPGYFPLLLGVVLALIGAVIMFQSLVVETPDGNPVGPWAFKPLILIVLSNLLYGILLGGIPSLNVPAMGLIVAIYGLVILAALAGTEFRWREVLVLATILAAGSWAAFVWGLKLQFQVWPTFLG
ncbi:MAG: tripartite tricarboxylate transporter TctB family protein [Burkholderiaceae bacterium]|nr:tripartite tricarboxylate transporter TctB family protein [Burkholderiaceae bacterium]